MEHAKLKGSGAHGLDLNMDRQLVLWAKTAENLYGIQFLLFYGCGIVGKLWSSSVKNIKGFFMSLLAENGSF